MEDVGWGVGREGMKDIEDVGNREGMEGGPC